MVSYITPTQRAAQRNITAPTFTDTARRGAYTVVSGDYGTGTGKPTYTSGASFPCSFQGKAAKDLQQQSQVPSGDADLYYALGTTLGAADRVTITRLLGEAVTTPQTYEIVGGPFIRHNLIHAQLRLVTEE